jgi:heptaprenylglycerol acetyltransferase
VPKSLYRRTLNRALALIARVCPGAQTLRPACHRARGVRMGRNVFVGDGAYFDNEFPECIEIGDNAQISIRAVLIAHTRGPGRIIVGRNAFIGPNATLVCGGGRTLRIGEGAVVGAGAVITKSVPPHLYMAAPAPLPVARVGVPLPEARSMEEFVSGLSPLPRPGSGHD